MTIRTNEKTVRFVRPFSLKGAERSFPAGAYRVITDEELIDGISLLAYRRVSTMILVPGGLHGSSVEMLSIVSTAEQKQASGARVRRHTKGPDRAPLYVGGKNCSAANGW
jgi:hypothetical protein